MACHTESSLHAFEIGDVIIPIILLRKLRYRVVNLVAHTQVMRHEV